MEEAEEEDEEEKEEVEEAKCKFCATGRWPCGLRGSFFLAHCGCALLTLQTSSMRPRDKKYTRFEKGGG